MPEDETIQWLIDDMEDIKAQWRKPGLSEEQRALLWERFADNKAKFGMAKVLMENERRMAIEDREREEKRSRWFGKFGVALFLWDFLSACRSLRQIAKHLRDRS